MTDEKLFMKHHFGLGFKKLEHSCSEAGLIDLQQPQLSSSLQGMNPTVGVPSP